MILASFLAASGATRSLAQDEASQKPIDGQEASRDAPSIAPQHHPWGRFEIGAWKEVRIVERTINEARAASKSITTRKETLEDVGSEHFTLRQEVSIEIEGQLVEAPPKTVTLCLATDESGKVESVAGGAADTLPLDGGNVDTQLLDIATSGDVQIVTARVWFSPEEPPYILKSITEAVSQGSKEPIWRRNRKVLGRNLPFIFGGNHRHEATFIDEQHATGKALRHSVIVWLDDVPGGTVTRWTKEMNTEGRVVRQEVETLVDWGGELRAKDMPPAGTEDRAD